MKNETELKLGDVVKFVKEHPISIFKGCNDSFEYVDSSCMELNIMEGSSLFGPAPYALKRVRDGEFFVYRPWYWTDGYLEKIK